MRNLVALCALLVVACIGCQDKPTQEQAPKPKAEPYRYGLLTELADKYGTDKGTKGHRYTDFYELLFMPLKDKAKKIFEIGVLEGASMKMLHDYFPNAMIYGADIVDCSSLDNDRMKTVIADQSKRDQLQKFIDEHGSGFDIMIDDGGHTMEQQQVSFAFLFKHVRPGGYYIIEDVHTSLYPDGYGAREDRWNTTLAMLFNYLYTKKIKSEYMTPEEQKYITEHIDNCQLHMGKGAYSLAWVFRKK